MRHLLIILSLFLFSLTIYSCSSSSDDGASTTSDTTSNDDNSTSTDNSTTTTDTTAPTVSSVSSSTNNGSYKINDNITVTVTFNDNVIVDNSSGNPRIQLETGTNDRYANYVSGNSTSILSFLYTVQSGDNTTDLDYTSTSSLSANNGTIQDNATNNANLTLLAPGSSGSLGANKDIVIDTTAPTISSIYPTDNQSEVLISDNISVTFSEAMDNTSVTTNTDNTTCYGSFALSSDNFSSCLQMSSSPSSSNSYNTFTIDPTDNLSFSTTYKIRVTTGVKDKVGYSLGSQYETSSGFTTYGLFVAVGKNGTIITSTDNGTTWTARSSNLTTRLQGIAFGNDLFAVVGYSGTIITSTDTITWTSRISGVGTSNGLWAVIYANNRFNAVGDGGQYTYSNNGISWNAGQMLVGHTLSMYDISYAENTFVTVGSAGEIFTSSDGSSWTDRSTSGRKWGVSHGNGTFVAAGDSGSIISSSDGTSWTSRTSGIDRNLKGITYGNSIFVAVGEGGKILTSSDGTTWTERTSGISSVLERVHYGNSTFVVVGESGTILTSSDATTWTSRTSGTIRWLYGITYTQ